MPVTPKHTITGIILDEEASFSLSELSSACSVRTEYIIELVDEGILEPRQRQEEWYFTGESLVRLQKARRLQKDLGVNLAGTALVLDLMEEIGQLREQLQYLNRGK